MAFLRSMALGIGLPSPATIPNGGTNVCNTTGEVNSDSQRLIAFTLAWLCVTLGTASTQIRAQQQKIVAGVAQAGGDGGPYNIQTAVGKNENIVDCGVQIVDNVDRSQYQMTASTPGNTAASTIVGCGMIIITMA